MPSTDLSVSQAIQKQISELANEFPNRGATALEDYFRRKLQPAIEIPHDSLESLEKFSAILIPFGQFPLFTTQSAGVFRIDYTSLDKFDKKPGDIYAGIVNTFRIALSLVPFTNTVVCDLLIEEKDAESLFATSALDDLHQRELHPNGDTRNLLGKFLAVDTFKPTTNGARDAAEVMIWRVGTREVGIAHLHYERYLNGLFKSERRSNSIILKQK